MTFPATGATWSIEHPGAINLPVEPGPGGRAARDLGPVTLVMSGDSVRSATVGPLEVLVSPAADGRSVGVLALSEGATVISSRATPEAPYLSFFGMLSDGSTVEGVIEATFARGGGRLTATDIKVSGPRADHVQRTPRDLVRRCEVGLPIAHPATGARGRRPLGPRLSVHRPTG